MQQNPYQSPEAKEPIDALPFPSLLIFLLSAVWIWVWPFVLARLDLPTDESSRVPQRLAIVATSATLVPMAIFVAMAFYLTRRLKLSPWVRAGVSVTAMVSVVPLSYLSFVMFVLWSYHY